MTILLQRRSEGHDRNSRHGNRSIISTAFLESAIKGTCGLRGSIAVFHEGVLTQVHARRSKRTYSTDVADELHSLYFAAIPEINQPGEVRGIRKCERERVKRVRYRTSRRSGTPKRDSECGRISIRKFVLVGSADNACGLAVSIANSTVQRQGV